MTDQPLRRILGHQQPDPGCDQAFELLDLYCEAVLRGADAERLFPEFQSHIENCQACREDTAGLLALLRQQAM